MFLDRLCRAPARILGGALGLATLIVALGSNASIAAPHGDQTALDRILVVVNDDVITESELSDRIAHLKAQFKVSGKTLPPDDVVRRQLLDRLVTEHLQLDLANRSGIRVTDADVTDAIETIARKNKMTLAEFRSRLIQEGIDPQQHAAEVRTQIILHELIDRQVNDRVRVSDAEIQNFLDNRAQDAEIEYNLSHIFLPIPESASADAIETAKKKAADIARQLKDGGNFEQLAITYSQGDAALNGGNIGWKKPGQLPELFVNAIKGLSAGTNTAPLRGPNGFHILRVNEVRGSDGGSVVVEQTHARHILLRTSEVESTDEVRAKLLALRNRIEHGEDFATLAKAHSEDPGSAAKGGDLGWTSPGQTVPEFEDAMKKLGPGELSQPVASPFGLHLIQVIERREQDATQERQRASARAQIRERKSGEMYEQWVRQLRDEAYVEYVGAEHS
jgi:peptidyl-prolyl cis-trans isomerase SurA